MSTTRRLDNIEQTHARQALRNGQRSFVDEVRAMLEAVDGQGDQSPQPGENLYSEIVRRLQVADGWSLALMPGETLEEKERAVDLVCAGTLQISDQARHAARGWFQLYAGLS